MVVLNKKYKRRCIVGLLALVIMAAAPGRTTPSLQIQLDLTELSLEELMDIRVTTVARKPEKLSEVPAAVHVVTREDIRRSGATSLPAALRLVPGLQVARIDASKWAISARGFNNRFANKLLVLIDGRSVYSPLFSGVFWEAQDMLLDNVERIEVVRGPGATLWGANAVNGILNVITRKAQDTQGGLIQTGGGTEERAFGNVRYGGKWGEWGHYRVYAKYSDRDAYIDSTGAAAGDEWTDLRGGFRIDWDAAQGDMLMLQGEIYDVNADERVDFYTLEPPYVSIANGGIDFSGGHLLGRWHRTLSSRSDLALQLYYDRTQRAEGLVQAIKPVEERRQTVDVDGQHRFGLGHRHDIVWGLGYRLSRDDISAGFLLQLTPPARSLQLFSAFVQDEIALVQERLYLTVGTKAEHNDFTGWEVQPNIRLLAKPRPGHTLWAALARAIREPARVDTDARLQNIVIAPDDPRNFLSRLMLVEILGNPELKAEELLAWEVGYRTALHPRLALDLAAFYNQYDKLRTGEPGLPIFQEDAEIPHVVLPAVLDNKMSGEAYGIEMTFDWRPAPQWQVRANYTYLELDLKKDRTSGDPLSEAAEDQAPTQRLALRTSTQLSRSWNADLGLRYVDRVVGLNVEAYLETDVRLAWQVGENLEISLVGQNLLNADHLEYRHEGVINTRSSRVQRGAYTVLRWGF